MRMVAVTMGGGRLGGPPCRRLALATVLINLSDAFGLRPIGTLLLLRLPYPVAAANAGIGFSGTYPTFPPPFRSWPLGPMAAQTTAALGWRPATLLVGQIGQWAGGRDGYSCQGGEMHLNGEALLPWGSMSVSPTATRCRRS